MRIISWNCNGRFRDKFKTIDKHGADIYIIQECENPKESSNQSYKQFAENHIWKGDVLHKGLGIFAKQGITLEKLLWNDHLLRHFIPVKINGDFTLLAVWACHPYIEEYAVYQDIHFGNYNENMIVMGDFNSNKIWDKNRIFYRSHSAVVDRLLQKRLYSAYHAVTKEGFGCERKGTFYMHRNKNKSYHIDYCFIRPERINEFSVFEEDFWLLHSDHMPLLLEVR